mmetsp:Transcript_1901/g.2957  ORF Transcript_1901/g.2957 Transcript_1901/m.2957 type:complete len:250 (+) Transcript_1901:605-1354(+)
MVLSLEAEPMMGSVGWNATSFTLPVCPGSLYIILQEWTSHTYTMRSALPAVILVPSFDQLHRSKSFSKLCMWPVMIFTQRFAGAYGRMSHTRIVLSMELLSKWLPSGLRAMPVTVSEWPLHVMNTLAFLRSQTLMVLSTPPVYTWSPASLNAAQVRGYLSVSVTTDLRARRSSSLEVESSDAVMIRGLPRCMGHTLFTTEPCSLDFLTCTPVLASHARTVLSAEHDTSCSPPGSQWTSSTPFWCPVSTL